MKLKILLMVVFFLTSGCANKSTLPGDYDIQLVPENGASNQDLKLGLDYFHGNGVKQDYTNAIKHFEMAGRNNVSEGYLLIGYMYSDGMGVEKDFNKSEEFYKLAASKGSLEARSYLVMRRMGQMALARLQDGPEYIKLRKAYRDELSALSKLGHAHSIALNSLMYINGDIESDNFKKAMQVNVRLFPINKELATLVKGIISIEEGNDKEGWIVLDRLALDSSKLVKEYIAITKKEHAENKFSKKRVLFGYRITNSLEDFLTRNYPAFGEAEKLLSSK